MSYESAPELSAFFKRMGVPVEVVDDPSMGKYVKATADIYPGVADAGKPNAGEQLEYAELFEESGIASWATSELLLALAKNHSLLAKAGKSAASSSAAAPIKADDALIGYCNESLALRYVDGKDGKAVSTFATLVADTLLDTPSSSSTPSKKTTFMYCSAEAQQNDILAAAILGSRGALRSLRKFHSELEKQSALLEQATIPISVESISRCIVSAVVRFLRSLERSVRAQFQAQPTLATGKKIDLLKDLLNTIGVEAQEEQQEVDASEETQPDKMTSPFITSLFEGSVRPFNRLVEPPEGSEFEASVKTKEWCRTIRAAIQKNITDVARHFTAALVCEMVGISSPSIGLQLADDAVGLTTTAGNSATGDDANDELTVVQSVLPSNAIKTLTLKSALNNGAIPTETIEQLLEWVPLVVQGWVNDATIVTLLGQTTINAQALTAVSTATEAGGVGYDNGNNLAAVEVVEMVKEEEGDNLSNFTMITQKNVHNRVPIFGAAVFTLQSCFNHSCAPNAEVVPTLPSGLGGHDIVVQAIAKDRRISSKGKVGGGAGGDESDEEADKESSKNDKSSDKKEKKSKAKKPLIKEGEEINITYIPTLYLALEDYVSRRQRLESYFFECGCKRCFRENAKAEKAEAKRKTKQAKSEKH